MGKLNAALPTGDGWVAVQQTLNSFNYCNYWARVHFAIEECLMRLVGVSELERATSKRMPASWRQLRG